MKKIIKSILAVCFAATIALTFIGCNKDDDRVELYFPDGTPALAIANLLDENKQFDGYETSYNVVAADTISVAFSSGAELAVMPTVAAAKLYSDGADVCLLSSNVFGNLYIVGVNATTNGLADFAGKVIYTTTGTTLVLTKYIFNQNSLQSAVGAEAIVGKVVLNSLSDGAEIIQRLALAKSSGAEAYGVLGEPQVTKCLANVAGSAIVTDLQSEWRALTGLDGYPQASLVAKKSFATDNSAYISQLLAQLAQNESFVNANYSRLSEIFERYNSSLKKMSFTAETVANCNLGYLAAAEAKASVISYVSAVMPSVTLDDNFFYSAA